ncbi:MAG: caspase family protein [Thermosynechococcaceae cyanobacterium]
MPQSVEQLVYTSFSGLESTMLASIQMSQAVQQGFEQAIVQPYLSHSAFGGLKMSAAYLHQIDANGVLFGWLYCDELAQDSRELVARFICYYLAQPLDAEHLDLIFDCLEKGPVTPLNGLANLKVLGPVVLPDSGDYEPTRSGVAIPSSVRAKNRLLLYKQKLLHCFVPLEEQWDDLSSLEPETEFMEPSVVVEAYPPLDTAASTLCEKQALLIGVSEHRLGIRSLPGVEKDLETLQQVLANPQMGSFAEVAVLLNPDAPTMAERIETFLANCPADGMALVYFSGYGVLDCQGTLCLSTGASRRNAQGKIVRSTFVASDFLGAVMRDSPCRQKTLILDICLSEEEQRHHTLGKPALDVVRQQLGGSGQAILVSSTAIGDVGAQKGFRPSVYTFYLVEGLATGIADANGDGCITLEEWHTYATHKTRLVSPALRPALYSQLAHKQQRIASVSLNDPKLRYRREVERLARNGQISLVNELILNDLQKSLSLSPEESARIMVEVLKPYNDYQLKVRRYALNFLNHLNREFPGKILQDNEIIYLQNALGLTNGDTETIKAEVIQRFHVIQSSEAIFSPLVAEGDVRLWHMKLQANLQYFASLSLPLTRLKGYLNRCLASLPEVNFRRNDIFSLENSTAKRTILQFKQGLFFQIERLTMEIWHRLPISLKTKPFLNTLSNSRGFSWRLSLLLMGSLLVLMGLTIASVALLNSRQKHDQEQMLQKLQSLVQQQKYDECETFGKSLVQSSRWATPIQSILEQCQTGLRWQPIGEQPISTVSSIVWAIAFRPNHQMLASGSDDGKIRLWDVKKQTLSRTLDGHRSRVWTVAFSRDGKMLASAGSDRTLNLWALSTGKLMHQFNGHQGTVWSIAFMPDERFIASSSEDGTIKLWNIATGTLHRTINPKAGAIRAIAAGSDRTTLFSGGVDKAITAWDIQTGQPTFKLQAHSDRVIDLALSQSGTTLVSGSADKTVMVWNLKNRTLLRTITDHIDSVPTLALSPDDRTLAIGTGGSIRLWDIQTGQFIREFLSSSSNVTAAAFRNDDQTLAIARQNKSLDLWQR